MTTHTVTTPVEGYSGTVGGVTFVDGQAVIDSDEHAAELAYFRAQGYGIDDNDAPAAGDVEPGPADGTIADVMARVGDDPDAASSALDAEQAKAKPRPRLVDQLIAVIAAHQPDDNPDGGDADDHDDTDGESDDDEETQS